jgi:hypothetical protein
VNRGGEIQQLCTDRQACTSRIPFVNFKANAPVHELESDDSALAQEAVILSDGQDWPIRERLESGGRITARAREEGVASGQLIQVSHNPNAKRTSVQRLSSGELF